jgi:hypothetical protein|tara:strand:- start:611 stop:877 length:267 start_codon:yes stop_codon:yes gene_type:complete
MNGRKAKAIRRKSLLILVDWIKTLVSDEEAKNLTKQQAYDLVPKETHVYLNNRLMLSAMSLKWIIKKIKKINKYKKLEDIKLEDVQNG